MTLELHDLAAANPMIDDGHAPPHQHVHSMIDDGHATPHHRVNAMAKFGSMVVFRQPGGERWGAPTESARIDLFQFPSLPQYHGGFSAFQCGGILVHYEGLH